MIAHVFAACLLIAAQNHGVPPAVLLGIMQVEGGTVGQEVGPNRNGSYDMGLMQINTLWLDDLSRYWGVPKSTARRWVRDDGCVNLEVSAWILRQKIDETGSLSKGIGHYHSRTPWRSRGYRAKVIAAMRRMRLIPDGL